MNNTLKQAIKFMLENKDIQSMFNDIKRGQKEVEAALKEAEKIKKKWK